MGVSLDMRFKSKINGVREEIANYERVDTATFGETS